MAQVVLDSVERIVLHVNSGERIKEETMLLALRSEGVRRKDANGATGPMGIRFRSRFFFGFSSDLRNEKQEPIRNGFYSD